MADLDKLNTVATAIQGLAKPRDHNEFNKLVTMTGKWERPVLNELCEMLGIGGRYDGLDKYSLKEIRLTREIEKKLGLKETGVIGPTLKHAIIDYIDKERAKLREGGLEAKLTAEQLGAEGTKHGDTKKKLAAEESGAEGTKHGDTKKKLAAEESGAEGTKHGTTKKELADEREGKDGTQHGNSRKKLLGQAEELRMQQNLRTITSWEGPMAGQGWDRFDHMVENLSSYKAKDITRMENGLIDQVAHIRARQKAIDEAATTKKDVSNSQYEKWAEAEKTKVKSELSSIANQAARLTALETKAMTELDPIVDVYGRRNKLKADTVKIRNKETGVETDKQVYRLDDSSGRDMSVAYKIGARIDHDNILERGFYRLLGRGAAEKGQRSSSGSANKTSNTLETSDSTVKIGDKSVVLTGVKSNTGRASADLGLLQTMPGIAVSYENDKLAIKRGEVTLATYDYKKKEVTQADVSANANTLKKIEADARAGLFKPTPVKHEAVKATVKLNSKEVEVSGLEANNKKLSQLATGLKQGLTLDHVNGKLVVQRDNKSLASYDYVLTETTAAQGVKNDQTLSRLETDLNSNKFDKVTAKAEKTKEVKLSDAMKAVKNELKAELSSKDLKIEDGSIIYLHPVAGRVLPKLELDSTKLTSSDPQVRSSYLTEIRTRVDRDLRKTTER